MERNINVRRWLMNALVTAWLSGMVCVFAVYYFPDAKTWLYVGLFVFLALISASYARSVFRYFWAVEALADSMVLGSKAQEYAKEHGQINVRVTWDESRKAYDVVFLKGADK